ncbi:MAG: NAD(P)/FAD-dependent oxidoreductase, partial [Eubacterium sp.]|nr:NAD(P)/FAD-dependent oxidoreductase [Candidatus Colimonas fimequi]
MNHKRYDILIIGAGAVGCALAWQLSHFNVKVAVLEKNSDVAGETTGRNSAVVHAGFNNKPGSLMARFCVEGNKGFEKLCEELHVPYKKTGKMVVALEESDVPAIERLLAQGQANGCEGLEIIDPERIRELMPDACGYKALWSPETAVTSPFLYCVALADNAAENGVEFLLDTGVTGIEKGSDGDGYVVSTGTGDADGEVYYAKIIVNCAGLGAADVASMAGIDKYNVYPCRGQYYILDVDS